MKQRRDFAWSAVERLLKPIRIKLLDGATEVDVPLWHTWYEGRSAETQRPSHVDSTLSNGGLVSSTVAPSAGGDVDIPSSARAPAAANRMPARRSSAG